MIRYLPTLIVAAAVLGFAWWVMDLMADRRTLRAENKELALQLAGCGARMKNILEDQADDATVDDPGAFDVPDGWLMPETGAGND